MLETDLSPYAALLSAAILGAMVFFAGVVAPSVFRLLPAEPAGKFLRGLFPRYYDVLAALSAIAAVLAGMTWAGLLLAAIAGLFVWARFVLMPRINAARDAGPDDGSATRRFRVLHGASVAINLAQMLALVGVVVWLT